MTDVIAPSDSVLDEAPARFTELLGAASRNVFVCDALARCGRTQNFRVARTTQAKRPGMRSFDVDSLAPAAARLANGKARSGGPTGIGNANGGGAGEPPQPVGGPVPRA